MMKVWVERSPDKNNNFNFDGIVSSTPEKNEVSADKA